MKRVNFLKLLVYEPKPLERRSFFSFAKATKNILCSLGEGESEVVLRRFILPAILLSLTVGSGFGAKAKLTAAKEAGGKKVTAAKEVLGKRVTAVKELVKKKLPKLPPKPKFLEKKKPVVKKPVKEEAPPIVKEEEKETPEERLIRERGEVDVFLTPKEEPRSTEDIKKELENLENDVRKIEDDGLPEEKFIVREEVRKAVREAAIVDKNLKIAKLKLDIEQDPIAKRNFEKEVIKLEKEKELVDLKKNIEIQKGVMADLQKEIDTFENDYSILKMRGPLSDDIMRMPIKELLERERKKELPNEETMSQLEALKGPKISKYRAAKTRSESIGWLVKHYEDQMRKEEEEEMPPLRELEEEAEIEGF